MRGGLVCAVLVLSAWAVTAQPTNVGGAETNLAARTPGTIVWARSVGGLVGVTLPALTGIVPDAFVQILGGPDEHGRIVYIERRLAGRQFANALKVIRTDGTDDRMIAPVRTAIGASLGERLALAPRNGRAAFVNDTRGAAIANRPYYVAEGPLELWDLDARQRLPLRLDANWIEIVDLP